MGPMMEKGFLGCGPTSRVASQPAGVRTDLRSSASCSPRSAAWALQRVSLKPHIGITHRNGGLKLDGSEGQGGLG